MKDFQLQKLQESAIDAFLEDPDLRGILFADSNRTALQTLLEQRANKRDKDVKKRQPQPEALPPADREPLLQVIISRDEMSVWVELHPFLKGCEAGQVEALIFEQLAQMQVTYGIMRQQISRLAKNPIYAKRIVIAKGKHPQEGEQGAVHFLFPTDLSLSPPTDGFYGVDISNPEFVHMVRPGEPLCTLSSKTNDFTGRTVKGRLVHPQKGGVNNIVVGENVRQAADGKKWYSLARGEVVFKNGVLSVTPILQLDAVDANTGDITFHGSVYIAGSVSAGRVVEATNNVLVGGMVEGCKITAGGHLVVAGGITGGDVSDLRVGGSVRTPFLEFAKLMVEGEVYVDATLGTKIHCHGGIYAQGDRGRIVGGEYVAHEIFANEIGNQSNAKTTLIIESLQPFQDQIAILREELEKWNDRGEQLETLISHTSNDTRHKILESIVQQVRDKTKELTTEIGILQHKVDGINHHYSFEIRVQDELNANVVCKLAGRTLQLKESLYKRRVYMGKDGTIEIRSL